MSRTKDGATRPRTGGASRALVLALTLAVGGCADSGGLRSVWPDRPTLRGLWDRKAQAPTQADPADAPSARSMRAARGRFNPSARRPGDDGTDPVVEDGAGPPGPDDLPADDARERSASHPARRPAAPADDPETDETIRVTLGAPEPLPSRSRTAEVAPVARRPSASRVVEPETEPESAPPPIDRSPAPALVRRDEERPEPIAMASTSGPAPRRAAAAKPASAAPAGDARAILARSEAKLRSLGTYQVKMSRVERVDGRLQPEEEVILSVHRQPKEVRLAWASGPSEGREVIYSTRVDAKSLFVHMAKSAIPLPTMKMAIDSPMVTRSSRHSITEAGFDTIIENLRRSVDQVDAANTAQGRAAYRGIEKPPGLDRPSHVFTRRSPNGESWTVFIDARSLLPSMVVAKNPAGELDEKYVYQEVSENPAELAAADAFNPDQRWGASSGLLSRFARAASPAPGPSAGQSKTR